MIHLPTILNPAGERETTLIMMPDFTFFLRAGFRINNPKRQKFLRAFFAVFDFGARNAVEISHDGFLVRRKGSWR